MNLDAFLEGIVEERKPGGKPTLGAKADGKPLH
jgi:hypothetical protein